MSESEDQEFLLKIPGDSRHLAMMRSVLSEAVAAAGFDEDVNQRIILAVGEAVNNILAHCYQGACKPVTLCCLVKADRLEIRLRDYGPKPDPSELVGRDLEEVRPGGLGIHIMRQTMDEVEYDMSPEVGTELRLVKYRPGAGPAAGPTETSE